MKKDKMKWEKVGTIIKDDGEKIITYLAKGAQTVYCVKSVNKPIIRDGKTVGWYNDGYLLTSTHGPYSRLRHARDAAEIAERSKIDESRII